MNMGIVIREVPQGCTTVKISGELDISTAPELRERLLAILNRHVPSRLILDLSGLEFMDSSGVAVLVNTERRARLLGRTVALVAPRPPVRRILRVCGVDQYLPIFDDVSAASAGPQADRGRPVQAGPPLGAGESGCASL